jgi:hypothetical protein
MKPLISQFYERRYKKSKLGKQRQQETDDGHADNEWVNPPIDGPNRHLTDFVDYENIDGYRGDDTSYHHHNLQKYTEPYQVKAQFRHNRI